MHYSVTSWHSIPAKALRLSLSSARPILWSVRHYLVFYVQLCFPRSTFSWVFFLLPCVRTKFLLPIYFCLSSYNSWYSCDRHQTSDCMVVYIIWKQNTYMDCSPHISLIGDRRDHYSPEVVLAISAVVFVCYNCWLQPLIFCNPIFLLLFFRVPEVKVYQLDGILMETRDHRFNKSTRPI